MRYRGRSLNQIVIVVSSLCLCMAATTENAQCQAEEAQPEQPESSGARQLGPEDKLEERCPGAQSARNRQRQYEARHGSHLKIDHVSRPALQHELLVMQQRDVEVRTAFADRDKGISFLVAWQSIVEPVDQENQKRIREIVSSEGVPSASMVGYDGLSAAWLLIQHGDLSLQEHALPSISKLVREGQLAPQNEALLIDRILVGKGKPQRFGTQFYVDPDSKRLEPRPIEDESHLDRRRASLGLIPFALYACVLRQSQG